VAVINAVRAFLQWDKITWNWTYHIPGGTWVILSLIISIGVCVWQKMDLISEISGAQVPLTGTWAYVATGVGIAISSNVIAQVYKPLAKVARAAAVKADVRIAEAQGTCTTPEAIVDGNISGPPPTEPVVSPVDNSIDVTSTVTAQLLYWKDGTAAYIILTGSNGKQKIVPVA
jgi:hypothetical protein